MVDLFWVYWAAMVDAGTAGKATLRGFSLGLTFVVELAAFAAFGYWGASVGGGAPLVLLVIAAPSRRLSHSSRSSNGVGVSASLK